MLAGNGRVALFTPRPWVCGITTSKMGLMKDLDNTIVWRKERGYTQKPEAVLLYCPNSITSAKLKGILHLHELTSSEPYVNTMLVAGETKILGLIVRQWRDLLTN